MTDEPDPSRCPLCGRPNECALATAETTPPGSCWCRSERFPETLLAQAPPTACICRRCQQGAVESAQAGPEDAEGEPRGLLESKAVRD